VKAAKLSEATGRPRAIILSVTASSPQGDNDDETLQHDPLLHDSVCGFSISSITTIEHYLGRECSERNLAMERHAMEFAA
jgi:hypothetical protein